MSEDQFTKLFKYMQEFRHEVDGKFEDMDKKFTDRFDHLEAVIDGYAGRLDTYAQEFAALDHKVSRLEKYIQVFADKAGIDLDTIRI